MPLAETFGLQFAGTCVPLGTFDDTGTNMPNPSSSFSSKKACEEYKHATQESVATEIRNEIPGRAANEQRVKGCERS